VDERLGVGFGPEVVPVLLQPAPQHVRVLDYAVVDEGERAGAIDMGMRVALRGRAVRGPARMADAARPVHGVARQQVTKVRDPPRELAGFDAAAVEHGNAGGVVSAVFEPAQAFDQH